MARCNGAGLSVWIALFIVVGVAGAQKTSTTTPAASTPALAVNMPDSTKANEAKARVELSPDEKAYQSTERIADPKQRVEALVKFVAEYPEYPYIRNVIYILFRDSAKSRRGTQKAPRDPKQTKLLVDKFVAGTVNAPVYARAEFYYGISKNLASSDLLLEDAAVFGRKAIPLLNESEYVANERRMWESKTRYQKRRDPNVSVDPFSIEESKLHFVGFSAAVHANLGNVLFKLGQTDGAAKSLRDAYDIRPIMEAAAGLSNIEESRGNLNNALKYMMDAALTGRLPADKIAHLQGLYTKVHGGNADGLQASLDKVYRERYKMPLQFSEYKPGPTRTRRMVLAEFVTGAGCEPCTAVDVAFDAALRRYNRDELALLVYHMHAPTSDPMSNASAEERQKYYDVQGAPTVILDGRKVNPGEGTKTEAGRVSEALNRAIDERLDSPELANITLESALDDHLVRVSTKVAGVRGTDHPLRLVIALVENEISYSGENGLRFHPMVVRNVAHPNPNEPAGFDLPAGKDSKFEYSFDVKQISADNLTYYATYSEDLFKRVGITATFREKRNDINEKNLSVVAFVQDQETKEILQAAYARVEPPGAAQSAAK